jgi:hypothetical protein
VDRLFGVLVATIVAEPNIVTLFRENEGKNSLSTRKADPDFAVHEEAMVQVDHLSVGTGADIRGTLMFLRWYAMQS